VDVIIYGRGGTRLRSPTNSWKLKFFGPREVVLTLLLTCFQGSCELVYMYVFEI
jgi:hypothetical protein